MRIVSRFMLSVLQEAVEIQKTIATETHLEHAARAHLGPAITMVVILALSFILQQKARNWGRKALEESGKSFEGVRSSNLTIREPAFSDRNNHRKHWQLQSKRARDVLVFGNESLFTCRPTPHLLNSFVVAPGK